MLDAGPDPQPAAAASEEKARIGRRCKPGRKQQQVGPLPNGIHALNRIRHTKTPCLPSPDSQQYILWVNDDSLHG